MTTFLFTAFSGVAIGLLFCCYWMMMCGSRGMAARSHGERSSCSEGHAGHSVSDKPIDPVCGMEIDPSNAAGSRLVGREVYFFCSQNCLDAFERNPSRYVHRPNEHAGHHGQAC